MKTEEIMVLVLAGVAVFLVVQAARQGKIKPSTGGTCATCGGADLLGKVAEIFTGSGKPYGNGWRYFSDGTAIDPQGRYYKGGQLIWEGAK